MSQSLSLTDRAVRLGANHVRLCMFVSSSQYPGSCESEVSSYDLNTPFDDLAMVMERAAQHLAYSAKRVCVTSYVSKSGMVAEARHGSVVVASSIDDVETRHVSAIHAHTPAHAGAPEFRFHESRLEGVEELPGANVVCLFMSRSTPPANRFSWALEDMVEVRECERVCLRVNAFSKLFFESARVSLWGGKGERTVRQVYLSVSDVDKIPNEQRAEVNRTLENTVQAVMMGARLKRTPKRL
jgi:hypothetical protein